MVHMDLHGVDLIPRKAESLEFAFESGLVVGLVDGHDEAVEHVDPHLLKRGVNALEDWRRVSLEFVPRQAGCAVNGHELCHVRSDTPLGCGFFRFEIAKGSMQKFDENCTLARGKSLEEQRV
jgi:hypothetical protein